MVQMHSSQQNTSTESDEMPPPTPRESTPNDEAVQQPAGTEPLRQQNLEGGTTPSQDHNYGITTATAESTESPSDGQWQAPVGHPEQSQAAPQSQRSMTNSTSSFAHAAASQKRDNSNSKVDLQLGKTDEDIAPIMQLECHDDDDAPVPPAQIAAIYEEIEGQKDSTKNKSHMMPSSEAPADHNNLGVGGSQVPEDPLMEEALPSDQYPVAALGIPTTSSNQADTAPAANQGVPTASPNEHSASHLMEASSNDQSRPSVPNFHAVQATLVEESEVFEATLIPASTPPSSQAGNDPRPLGGRKGKVITSLVLIIGAMAGITGTLLASQGDSSDNGDGIGSESDLDDKAGGSLIPSPDKSPKPSSSLLTKNPSLRPAGGPSLVPSNLPSEIANPGQDVYGQYPFQGYCTKDGKSYDLFQKDYLFSGSSGYSVCASFCAAHAGPGFVGMGIKYATGTCRCYFDNNALPTSLPLGVSSSSERLAVGPVSTNVACTTDCEDDCFPYLVSLSK